MLIAAIEVKSSKDQIAFFFSTQRKIVTIVQWQSILDLKKITMSISRCVMKFTQFAQLKNNFCALFTRTSPIF